MEYDEILKKRRLDRGMTQQQVADKLGYSIMTVSYAERPYAKSMQLPSERYLRKFAKQIAQSAEDRVFLEKQLLTARAIAKMPDTIRTEFTQTLSSRGVAHTGAMPAGFRDLVKKDWRAMKKAPLRGFSVADMDSIISGERLLSRDETIDIAKALDANSERYLWEARYVTDRMLTIAERTGLLGPLSEKILAMPYKEFRMITEIVQSIVNIVDDGYGFSRKLKASTKK